LYSTRAGIPPDSTWVFYHLTDTVATEQKKTRGKKRWLIHPSVELRQMAQPGLNPDKTVVTAINPSGINKDL